ncbi:beta-glucosidase BglX [Terriglobus albidus]|uniref:Beta-glucosidase BglX n=1 Tax=Terriglobus albidus TaxID=1592106 RepID=A0A5B9E7N0_9BACT|nr:beta-glucosidase BglX [Terriglobus albidus]QEE27564.1 beta-glucosidase BglX [Terriglobus albidus]
MKYQTIRSLLAAALLASWLPLCGQTSATPEQRANLLLSKMSVDEKVGQLNQVFDFSGLPGMPAPAQKLEDQVRQGQIGSILFVTDPKRINALQKIAVSEGAHIPILFGFDVIHGFDTEFPVPVGMAASWDPEMARKAQSVAAEEAVHAGVRWTFAPMLDIARDPRWGRISEGAGEDPYLGAAMARAQVKGFQGEPGQPLRFAATLKHFAGYGAAEGGRDYDASYIPEELLQNVYLRPFQAGVEAGAKSVMSAYMDLNDVPATGNTHLLREILRDQMKFNGFVVSDANAVGDLYTHGFSSDAKDAAFRAAVAGVNMDMGSGTYLKNLKQLVTEGKVSATALDDLVRPILATKFALGLFDSPYADGDESTHAVMLAKHRDLARVAAARSAVLLRNEGGVLPLAKTTRRIAVIGPLGDSQYDMNGPWSLTAKPADTVTIVAGIRNKLPGADVRFAQGVQLRKQFPSMFDGLIGPKPEAEWDADKAEATMKEALSLANDSDVVVLALGESALMDFEYASRSSLALPGRQQELLEKIVATGKPVVLLLFSTRPLDVTWASQHVSAIMDCYFGGTETGNAVADLLFGDVSPAGKLPVTWPRNAGQIPIYYAHNLSHKPYGAPDFTSRYWDLPTEPLYPFGFGLSYASFEISNLRLSKKEIHTKDPVTAVVTVKNAGKVKADEVVQLYLHQKSGSASRPVRELKGFQRITLAPGESRDVSFVVGAAERTYWSSATHGWTLDASEFDVWAGDSSTASLHDTFSVVQ